MVLVVYIGVGSELEKFDDGVRFVSWVFSCSMELFCLILMIL